MIDPDDEKFLRELLDLHLRNQVPHQQRMERLYEERNQILRGLLQEMKQISTHLARLK